MKLITYDRNGLLVIKSITSDYFLILEKASEKDS